LPDQRLSKPNGISGGMPSASFEDREGNLWFGTLGGIDRLRPNRLRTMPVDRDQIMVLRSSASPEALELALGQFGKGLAEHRSHAFELKVCGTPRRLRPEVQDEIYAIAREAQFNASRYADATRIELELGYGAGALVVRVRDKGRGLDESVAAAGRRPGHWGLVGMRERAGGIGAVLAIDSAPGTGTVITVTMPGKMAY
jgi:signal transduction histidine kinase